MSLTVFAIFVLFTLELSCSLPNFKTNDASITDKLSSAYENRNHKCSSHNHRLHRNSLKIDDGTPERYIDCLYSTKNITRIKRCNIPRDRKELEGGCLAYWSRREKIMRRDCYIQQKISMDDCAIGECIESREGVCCCRGDHCNSNIRMFDGTMAQ